SFICPLFIRFERGIGSGGGLPVAGSGPAVHGRARQRNVLGQLAAVDQEVLDLGPARSVRPRVVGGRPGGGRRLRGAVGLGRGLLEEADVGRVHDLLRRGGTGPALGRGAFDGSRRRHLGGRRGGLRGGFGGRFDGGLGGRLRRRFGIVVRLVGLRPRQRAPVRELPAGLVGGSRVS